MKNKKIIFFISCFFLLFNFVLASDLPPINIENLVLVSTKTGEEITVVKNYHIGRHKIDEVKHPKKTLERIKKWYLDEKVRTPFLVNGEEVTGIAFKKEPQENDSDNDSSSGKKDKLDELILVSAKTGEEITKIHSYHIGPENIGDIGLSKLRLQYGNRENNEAHLRQIKKLYIANPGCKPFLVNGEEVVEKSLYKPSKKKTNNSNNSDDDDAKSNEEQAKVLNKRELMKKMSDLMGGQGSLFPDFMKKMINLYNKFGLNALEYWNSMINGGGGWLYPDTIKRMIELENKFGRENINYWIRKINNGGGWLYPDSIESMIKLENEFGRKNVDYWIKEIGNGGGWLYPDKMEEMLKLEKDL